VCHTARTGLEAPASGCMAKIFDISPAEVLFRRSQVGLRRAETPFQNFETPLLFDHI